MRLLVVTQAVDSKDQALSFFIAWLTLLAERFESVEVVCLKEGEHRLPSNVHVHSLGKERGRTSRVVYALRFLKLIIRLRKEYDCVFVHMNPEYFVLGGLLWKMWRKPASLWYSHKGGTWELTVAVMLADIVFTTAPKSVTFASPKLRYMGHGIEVAKFHCVRNAPPDVPVVLTVGRITPIKHCETLIEAVALLHTQGVPVQGVFAGGPVHESDRKYEERMREEMTRLGIADAIEFTGAISADQVRERNCAADISVNMVPTGGMDKSVLEGMAAGNLVLTSNEAFREILGPYADRLIFTTGDATELARKIQELWHAPDRETVRAYLVRTSEEFDVRALIGRISDAIEANAQRFAHP